MCVCVCVNVCVSVTFDLFNFVFVCFVGDLFLRLFNSLSFSLLKFVCLFALLLCEVCEGIALGLLVCCCCCCCILSFHV